MNAILKVVMLMCQDSLPAYYVYNCMAKSNDQLSGSGVYISECEIPEQKPTVRRCQYHYDRICLSFMIMVAS